MYDVSALGVDECMINVRYYVSFTVHLWVRSNSSSTTVCPSSLIVTDVSQQMKIPGFLFRVLVRTDHYTPWSVLLDPWSLGQDWKRCVCSLRWKK